MHGYTDQILIPAAPDVFGQGREREGLRRGCPAGSPPREQGCCSGSVISYRTCKTARQ